MAKKEYENFCEGMKATLDMLYSLVWLVIIIKVMFLIFDISKEWKP